MNKTKDAVIKSKIEEYKKEYNKVTFKTTPIQDKKCCICNKKAKLKIQLVLSETKEPAPSGCCSTCTKEDKKNWKRQKNKVYKELLEYVCSKKCETMLILMYS